MGGYTSVSPINGLVAKLDSSGTVLWAQSATTSAISSLKFASIAVSSAGYVFVGSTGPGTATATDPRMGAIFSFTTSGTYSASTGFATTVTAKTPGGPVSLTTDSSGVYVCESPFSSNFNCTLLKLNNSLVTQWANKLTQSAGGYSTGAVTLFSNKNVPAGGLLVSGACYGPASGTNALVTMCVPSDGSHSGSTPLSVGSYTFFYEPDTSITQVTLPGVTTASFSLTAATASDTISSITVSQTVLSGTANGPTTV
jgi:hypothetical protein